MPKNQVVRYLIIGSLAYFIEMTALFVFSYAFKLGPVAAVAISFWVGFLAAFLLQKFITFKSHSKTTGVVGPQLLTYSLLAGWNYFFTLITTNLFANKAPVYIIRTITIAVITLWNFFIYKQIFKPKADANSFNEK